MKLYTKKGDDGGTVLFDGTRVRKDHLRVESYGQVDELNSCMGLAAGLIRQSSDSRRLLPLAERLTQIQSELFTLGAELATPADAPNRAKIPEISAAQIARLEGWIDEATETVPPLRTFVLPAGSVIAGQLHVCRTVCRRAERAVVSLGGAAALRPDVVIYLNRLSDLLFAWARWTNHAEGVPDVPWINPKA